MAYDPSQLHPGDVLLMTEAAHEPVWDHLFDDLIAGFSGGYFVHAALVGDGHLIEQIDPVTISPLDKYTANGWRYAVALTSDQREGLLHWAMARVGQLYGIKALLLDGAYFGLHIPAILRDHPQRVTCSGFVAEAFHRGAQVPITRQPLPAPISLAFSPLLLGPRPWDRS